ncbi:MAG: YceI family protein [Luteolibacter sp.]|uniref:YceI family protein n=1 Tax=Luteolibacter sp. TaxID=1962973 RepID=UPI003265EBBB
MKTKYLAFAVAAPLAFVSCENPADKTTDAKVSGAVEKTASNESGTKYVFTPASQVNFIGSKVTKSHPGGFKSFTGYFTLKDGAPVGNDHKVVIDMKSAFADSEKLTGHLKSPDFFDVEKFPEATFDVTGFKKDSDTTYTVSGNFTLHGQTKNISFPTTVSQTGDTVKIDAKFDINRKDFGIVYAGMADDLIRDQVVIELKLEAKPEA